MTFYGHGFFGGGGLLKKLWVLQLLLFQELHKKKSCVTVDIKHHVIFTYSDACREQGALCSDWLFEGNQVLVLQHILYFTI